jgi:ribonuclease BN (tRNA processing enzyme)
MGKIVFLGTAGARITVFRQLRASGGIWVTLDNINLLIDPGPGSLVKCCSSRANLKPEKLDGIYLSHRHLDHSADINVMIEAMTSGGFKKRGVVFAPGDALNKDPVILKYTQNYVQEVITLIEGGKYTLKAIKISTPVRHIHSVETYGANFEGKEKTISYIADTKFFPELTHYYRGNILIINVVREKPSEYDHLCLDDARTIIKEVRPELSILTHFGMTMLRAKPWIIAEKLSEEIGVKVVAARDGMKTEF